MKKITLHTAHRKTTAEGLVFADAGETLAVGTEIPAAEAAALVASGGAIDASGDGKATSSARTKPPVKKLKPRALADGEKLTDASHEIPLNGTPISSDDLAKG